MLSVALDLEVNFIQKTGNINEAKHLWELKDASLCFLFIYGFLFTNVDLLGVRFLHRVVQHDIITLYQSFFR
jgi:hypothetical protein